MAEKALTSMRHPRTQTTLNSIATERSRCSTSGVRWRISPSTRWIAESFTTAFDHCQADLNLVYLPHLDYDLQRHGPNGPHLAPALKELDDCIGTIVDHADNAKRR